MIKVSELEKSSVVEINNDPHVVEQIRVQSPSARGAATLYKIRYRNVRTRQKLDQTYRGDDTVKETDFDTRKVQFVYRDGDKFTFMDLEDYTQFELGLDEVEEATPYLVDGMEGIELLVMDERILGIKMPDVVELDIVECDPPLRGASATSRTKPAKTSTGLSVQVPEYMDNRERIRVDTRSGDFISRA